MMLKYRQLALGFVAFILSLVGPSVSKADITIQVQEVDASGNPISGGSLQTIGSTTANVLPSSTATTANFSIGGVVAIFNPTSSSSATITTTANFTVTNFTSTDGLQVITTYTSTNPFPGGTLSYSGQPADTVSGVSGGTGSTAPTGTLTEQAFTSSMGVSTLTSTAVATSSTGGGGASENNTVTNLPASYSIVQTMTLYINGDGKAVSGGYTGNLNGSLSIDAVAVPVPAPGGLALALIGIPFLGLRRALRRSAA